MISAVVPYRETPSRADLLDAVVAHLAIVADEVVVIDGGGDPFSRGVSINAGVEQATGDLIFICDADLLVPYEQLDEAIIMSRSFGMVIPFDEYLYLTSGATRRILDGAPLDPAAPARFRMKDSVGGACVIRRATFDAVGGFDSRFRGWGGEDYAFWAAVNTLDGPVGRVEGPLYHLHHVMDDTRPQENIDLMARFLDALGDITAMRELLEEAP